MIINEENNKVKIVDSSHKLLGKHVIFLKVPLTFYDASKTAERLNSIPSNNDQEMFTVNLFQNVSLKRKITW